MDDPGAALAGLLVVTLDHPVNEGGLAGEVAVVGARGGARGDELLAVLGVGAHRGAHDLGGCCEIVEERAVVAVADQQGQLGRGGIDLGQLIARGLELVRVATAQREAQAVEAVVLDQILRDQCPGEAGGAPKNDVVGVGVAAHRAHLTGVRAQWPLARRAPFAARPGVRVRRPGQARRRVNKLISEGEPARLGGPQ